jgi:hypothetical protein
MATDDRAVPTPVFDNAVVTLIVYLRNLAGNLVVVGHRVITVTITTDVV